LVINLDVLGPFQVQPTTLTLRPKEATRAGADRAGPVGWWKFDEANGATAANAAGARLTGQLHGSPRWATDRGRHQGALEFDGANTWVECADSAGLELRESLSVAVWVKGRAPGKADHTLLAKGDAWRLQRLHGKGDIEFALTGPQTSGSSKGKPPRVASKRPLAEEQWHHIVATYDGKRIALYLDGVEEAAATASGPLALNNLPVTLGENAANRGRLWSGWLDEARLYDRGLSSDEVSALYRAAAGQDL